MGQITVPDNIAGDVTVPIAALRYSTGVDLLLEVLGGKQFPRKFIKNSSLDDQFRLWQELVLKRRQMRMRYWRKGSKQYRVFVLQFVAAFVLTFSGTVNEVNNRKLSKLIPNYVWQHHVQEGVAHNVNANGLHEYQDDMMHIDSIRETVEKICGCESSNSDFGKTEVKALRECARELQRQIDRTYSLQTQLAKV
ncbi:MAG: hypothetical protein MHM6MM_004282 [Cercozoa sp. M6MM]